LRKVLISIFAISVISFAQTVKDIKFTNLTKVSTIVAKSMIDFDIDDTIDPKKINDSIKEFYMLDYFDDIKVLNHNGVLEYIFVEKPIIANIKMQGYKARDEDIALVLDIIGLKKGSIYSKNKIDKAKEKLKEILRDEGFNKNVIEIETIKLKNSLVALNIIVNKGDEIIITNTKYNGAKYFTKEEFDDVIANKELECCSWFFGQNDGVMATGQLQFEHHRIRELYLEHGFMDIEVSKAVVKVDYDNKKSTISYDIKEGKQYRIGKINIQLSKKDKNYNQIKSKLELKSGDIFNLKKLRADVEFIKFEVSKFGYAFVKVGYDMQKYNNTVDISYKITPGQKVYINDIIISGNKRTIDRVIRRNIYLSPGDLYSLRDLKDSKNALRRTGLFDSVVIDEQRVSQEKMNLVVKVKEARTGELMFGGGYGSQNGFSLNASIKDKNIFGSGKSFGFSLEKSSINQKSTIFLNNPSINDSKYDGSSSLYKSESENKYESDSLKASRVGGTLGIGKKLSRYTRTGVLYKLERVTETRDINTTNDVDYVTSSLTPYIYYNNTDDYYVPREGIDTRFSIEYAGVGGDSKYLRTSGSFKQYFGLKKYLDIDMILRYKIRVRTIEDLGEIHEGDSYWLGGVHSVRGYRAGAFGGNSDEPYTRFASSTLSVTFPLLPSAKIRWATFLDAGSIGKKRFDDIKKYSYGVAIEWYSMVGPIRLIWAKPIEAEEDDDLEFFTFSLGTKF